MDYTADWSYEGLAPERSKHLAGSPPYCELVRQLADKLGQVKIEFSLDEGRYVPVDGALRPIFYVEVGEDLAEWFFSGVSGYRAQYYANPRNGLDANRYAFGKLERYLLLAAQKADFRMQDPMMTGANWSCRKRTYSHHCVWNRQKYGAMKQKANYRKSQLRNRMPPLR